MKNLFLLSFFFIVFSAFAQKNENTTFEINSKKCFPKTGMHLRLKNVFDDSRCPEDVQCVWAGEVSVTIEVYNDNKIVEEKTMTLNSKNKKENDAWFKKYISESKKITSIELLPYPKQNEKMKLKKQFIRVSFL